MLKLSVEVGRIVCSIIGEEQEGQVGRIIYYLDIYD